SKCGSKCDKFVFNEKDQEMPFRMIKIVDIFRKIVKDYKRILIRSNNNFPDSCGIASSASGYSALVKALNDFYSAKFSEKDLSILARMCSGSASRSIPKGIALCNKESSVSIGIWPEVRIFFILLSKDPKKVPSTEGMLRTQNSSFFYHDRMSRIEEKVKLCIEYINSKDFSSLCRMIIRDSNEIHSIMFETYPPIRYINDEGFKIMTLVDEYNEKNGLKIAYTFDAGPNPFIITLQEYIEEAKDLLKDYELKECN
ncbi:Diphosphomevalonate decarboxylase, partial [Nosema granulosis]